MIFLPVTELARLAPGGVLFFIGIKFLPGCPKSSQGMRRIWERTEIEERGTHHVKVYGSFANFCSFTTALS